MSSERRLFDITPATGLARLSGLLLLAIVSGCTGGAGPGNGGDDDQTALEEPTTPPVGPTATPLPGDDDSPTSGDDDASPAGDDDASPSGDDDTPPTGDDDATQGGGNTPTPPPPQPPSSWFMGTMLVADTPTGNVDVIRLADSARLWSYSVNMSLTPLCSSSSPCFLYEARHVVHEDRDYIDFLANVGINLRTVWARIAMDNTSTPEISLQGFDFSGVSNPGCTATVEQTCNAPESLPTQCSLWFGHSFQVLEDDPASKHIRMLIADHAGRIVQTTLDYTNGNKCGHVDWILDSSNPDWDATCQPNDIQLLKDHGTDYLTVTCRNMDSTFGKGQVQLFKRSGTGASTKWTGVWRFPDPAKEGSEYLNTPHNGRLTALAGGGYSLHYAHSDGLGTDWGSGDAGTVGTASLASIESPPNYLADEFLGLGSAHSFGFLRAVTLAPDGERLVVDSGSQIGFSALNTPAIYAMRPLPISDSSKDGGWVQTYKEQNLFSSSSAVDRVYQCSWSEPYTASWLDPSGFGAYLRSALGTPGTDCQTPVGWIPGPVGGLPALPSL